MSPKLRIEPASSIDFPGAYPYSPSTFEPGPSFKECLDAAGQYFPSQQDLQRITHNAASTVRGYIPPYPGLLKLNISCHAPTVHQQQLKKPPPCLQFRNQRQHQLLLDHLSSSIVVPTRLQQARPLGETTTTPSFK